MNYSKNYLVLIVVFLLSINVSAEKSLMKYGKITDAEIEMTACSFDSNASAVVLCDIGKSQFRITQNDITILFERHVRIKIFDKEAFDKGNFSIYLYKKNAGNEETLEGIKGVVYNIEDGEVIKTKLSKGSIFRDEINKNRNVVKVTMPNIKEGSILELKYTIENPFIYNLETWYFQDDIPTLQSQYTVANIEWYDYKNWTEGYHNISKTSSVKEEKFSYHRTVEATFHGTKMGEMAEIKADVNYVKYRASNVPAFKDEPYITTVLDYLSSVHFELQSINYPWSPYKNYSKTWSSINKMLYEHEKFGTTLKYCGHLKKRAEKIKANSSIPKIQAIQAYNHIRDHMVWNSIYSIYSDYSIKKAYSEKSGRSSDINLNLVALCKLIGLEAHPLIISTRKHGKIRPGIINLSQFNHVIAAVKIDDKYMVLDAIDKDCPYNLLPVNSLNEKGRLVTQDDGEWIDLYSSTPYNEVFMVSLAMDNDLALTGDLTYKGTNYAALSFRNNYQSEESEEDFIIEFEEKLGEVEISNIRIENLDSIAKPIVMKSKIEIDDGINKVGEMVFFNPRVIQRNVENVFKREERTYPVDYNYPIRQQFIISIKLPETYTVEELPKPVRMALSDNKGSYLYSIKSIGNTIQLMNKFNINQTVFSGTEYPELKKFYEMMVSKEAEQVVVNKRE